MASLSPSEAVVLLAVHQGASTPREIARLLNASEKAVEKIVARLVNRGLLEWREERRFLFLRRRRLALTELGLEALPEAQETLQRMLLGAKPAPRPGGEKKQEEPQHTEPPMAPLAAMELAAILPMLLGIGLLGALFEDALSGDEVDKETLRRGFNPEDWV